MKQFLVLSTVTTESFGKGLVQLVYIFILCIVIFVGAYYTSKLLGNYQFNKKKLSNLKIIEVMSVGPQKSIQLIMIGSEYILIGVTKDNIIFIKEIPDAHIDLSLLSVNMNQSVPFNKYLDQLLKKKSSDHNKDE